MSSAEQFLSLFSASGIVKVQPSLLNYTISVLLIPNWHSLVVIILLKSVWVFCASYLGPKL